MRVCTTPVVISRCHWEPKLLLLLPPSLALTFSLCISWKTLKALAWIIKSEFQNEFSCVFEKNVSFSLCCSEIAGSRQEVVYEIVAVICNAYWFPPHATLDLIPLFTHNIYTHSHCQCNKHIGVLNQPPAISYLGLGHVQVILRQEY